MKYMDHRHPSGRAVLQARLQSLPGWVGFRLPLLAGIAVLPATLLLLPDVAEVLYTLLWLAGALLLLKKGWRHPENRKILRPTLLTTGFFLIAAASVLVSGEWSGWFRPLKKLFELLPTPFVALLLIHARVSARFMLRVVKVTSLILCTVALCQLLAGVDRPGGAVSPLVFGHIALLLGFFSLTGFPREDAGERVFSLAAFFAGLMSAVISQSRITLVTALFLGASTLFLWYRSRVLSFADVRRAGALFVVLVVVTATLPLVQN
jgi:hypothetical protein